MRLFPRCAVLSLVLVAGFVACNADRGGFATPPPLVDTNDAGLPDACAGVRCSRDLHKILDGCNDTVVQDCGDEQGCAAGKCTSPCEAASQAQGSIGCSFWAVPPDVPRYAETSCFAAFIANTWSTPIHVKGSFGGDPLDVSKCTYRAVSDGGRLRYERIEDAIAPGEVGIVFLSQGVPGPNNLQSIACPQGVDVAYRGTAVSQHETSIYKAFHLETDAPVSAYSIFPYGGARSYLPSATLLLPTSSWGTNYLIVDGFEETVDLPFVQIIAAEDDTVVRIKPRVDIRPGETVTGAARDIVGSWTLSRGQVLEFHQSRSLAGSPLESSRPVAVFGGTKCSYIPGDVPACDSLHQQIPPIQQWGDSYSGVPYKTRRVGPQGADPIPEIVMWRIGGARDGTILSYEPERPEGAPAVLGSGELAFFETDRTFIVRSQGPDFPIYLANYMTGSSRYSTDGDPDFVNVVANAQFLDSYVFFVDYTYANSTLTLVRKKDAKGFHDVFLDCAGAISDFKPLGANGDIEYTWVDVTKGGAPVTTAGGTCGYGRHEAKSDGPFGLYVWGTDSFASYGFPAGAGSRPTSPYVIEVR